MKNSVSNLLCGAPCNKLRTSNLIARSDTGVVIDSEPYLDLGACQLI